MQRHHMPPYTYVRPEPSKDCSGQKGVRAAAAISGLLACLNNTELVAATRTNARFVAR
jgi:hypothetical protein